MGRVDASLVMILNRARPGFFMKPFSIKRLFNLNERLILSCHFQPPLMELNEKQVHIIKIAERLFAEQGYDGTSIRDISKEADTNIAMVSYYFGSKEKLMEAIFHYRINHSWFSVQEILENGNLNPMEKILALVDSFVDRLADKSYFHSIVVRQQLLGERSPMLEMLNESRQRNFKLINGLVLEGQQQGIFHPDVDVAMLMITMVGTGYQLMHSKQYYKNVSGIEIQDAQALDLDLKARLKRHLHQIMKSLLINPQYQ